MDKPATLFHALLQTPDAPTKLLVLAQVKELSFQDSYIQQQLIKEGCIPALISFMDSPVEEENALAAAIIMRVSLLGM